MKLLLLGLIVISIVVISLCIRNKEGLNTINLKADPANDYWYRCSTGGTYATYNAATLTQAQKALAEKIWPGGASDHYACAQACKGSCQRQSQGIMGSNGRLGGWIKPNARRSTGSGIKTIEEDYLKKQDKYWDYRKWGSLDDASNFLKLKTKKEPFEISQKLVDKTVASQTPNSEIAAKIEKCRTLTDCKDLVDNNCGYCWYTDKFQYGDAKGPVADVCPKNGWAPPGDKASYFCKKIQEQKICKKVKDCGGTVGEASICGWCPTSNKALVMEKNHLTTENKIHRWVTGSCQPLGGENKTWCNDTSRPSCETLKGTEGRAGSVVRWKTRCSAFPLEWYQKNACKDKGGEKEGWEDCGWPGWQGRFKCKKTTTAITSEPKRTRCYWEEKMNSKIVPTPRQVMWPKYNDDWAKCKNAVSKDLVQPQATFKPGLVPPGLCAKFKQEFPCMSPKALTGPHSGACLESLWKNSGCAGTVNSQISKSGLNSGTLFNLWNTHSYSDAGANMTAFPNKANSSNYDKSQKYTKACYNENVDSCNPRFNPRPKECTLRLYNEMGGKAPGKLYPKNEDKWPNTWVPAVWKKEGTWSTGKYQDEIASTKKTANVSKAMLRQNPREYDIAAKTNMQIYGNKPAPPFAKPCWDDMLDIAKSLESAGITFSGKDYIDYKNAHQFNILPNTNDLNRIKNGDLNVYNYRLYKQTFENPNFPYWDAIWKYEDYWKTNWNKFKGILSSVRGVIADDKTIGLSKNIIMSSFITSASPTPKCIPVPRIQKMKGDQRMRPWGRTYDQDYYMGVAKCKTIPLNSCNGGWGGRCEQSSPDKEYVYITKESYNKPGFPYALLVNMSQ